MDSSTVRQRPYTIVVSSLAVAAAAVVVLAHFWRHRPMQPAQRLGITQKWLVDADPDGPHQGQFGEAGRQIVTVYRIFGNLPREQRTELLEGRTLTLEALPTPAQQYVVRFVQYLAHNSNPVPMAGGTIRAESRVDASQSHFVLFVVADGNQWSYSMDG